MVDMQACGDCGGLATQIVFASADPDGARDGAFLARMSLALFEDPAKDGQHQPILLPSGGLLRTHDVGQRGHIDVGSQDGEMDGIAGEILEPGRSARPQREIEPSVIRQEIPDVRAGERLPVVMELKTARLSRRPHPRVHLAKRRGEPIEVLSGRVRHDVDVGRHVRGTVDHGREPTDQHVPDAVPAQRVEDALGLEPRRVCLG